MDSDSCSRPAGATADRFMPLRIACQMDPIEHIDIAGDSTFALLLEAQRRGHEIFYYTPPGLTLEGSRLLAKGFTLAVAD
jgi:glutathione synthase